MIYVFVLTYNEQRIWWDSYPMEFVEEHFKANNIKFVILDNGNQPLMEAWCRVNDMIYYSSEYNIGSAGGYNWIFKVARKMGLENAILMQADVVMNNSFPLTITHRFTQHLGKTHFICWPQQLYNFWKNTESMTLYENNLENLGNLVGFNPIEMYEKDCYFDDNYVVTHFDDLEFMNYLITTKKFSHLNVPYMIGSTNQYYSNDIISGVDLGTFNIADEKFHLKIHHASIHIDHQVNNIDNSHKKWHDFNKPYYDQVLKPGMVIERLPYDPSRWTQFGYPPYPTQHEIDRFFVQYPELLVIQD